MPFKRSSRTLIVFTLWLVAYFGARVALEATGISPVVRISAALAPLPFFAAFLVLIIRELRAADELERRIQGEALAIAYPLVAVMLMTLALMERAVGLKFQDWSYMHVWIYVPLFYLLGLVIARRRYT
ncbi:MAG: hypothetical protein WC700_10890 [Gemmatimonadaceae bacterium]